MFAINNNNSKFIKILQWGITDSKSQYPILKTWNITSCVAVTFYNTHTKEAALVYFATKTKPPFTAAKKLITLVIKTLTRATKNTKLVVNLAATNHKNSIIEDIYYTLVTNDNLLVNPPHILRQNNSKHQPLITNMIAIDSRTGNITNNFPTDETNTNNNTTFNNYLTLQPSINCTTSLDITVTITKLITQLQQDESPIATKITTINDESELSKPVLLKYQPKNRPF